MKKLLIICGPTAVGKTSFSIECAKKYNGKLFTDGGTFDNVPTYPLLFHDIDFMLIIHTTPNYCPPEELYDKRFALLDVNVTSECEKMMNTFSFQKNNLMEMYNGGKKLGVYIANEIKDISDIDRQKIHGLYY